MSVPVAYYFYRLREDDFANEFCVAGNRDPALLVETLAPDGTPQRWAKRSEGDLTVFTPPDGYAGSQGFVLRCDPRYQVMEPMPREELERQALRCRKSVNFPGAKSGG
jgi:hypothetical protein